MTPTTLHQPVILLLGKRRNTQDEVDTWLAESGYSTCEATDVFQVLERLSDFTVGESPDVVLLHVDRDAEREMLENMLLATDGDFHASVIAYCGNESQRITNHDTFGLPALARQLERLIPAGSQVN
jgi:hypothetical protein